MKPFQPAREAAWELDEAAAGYEEKQPGLGDRFLDDFDDVVAYVRQHPSASPRVRGIPSDLDIRQRSFFKFPYTLIYMVLESEIRGLAVSHVRRRPGYWLRRVPPAPRR